MNARDAKTIGSVFKYVCAIALKLPGVEVSTTYGTPSFKVRRKVMARLRCEADGSLALCCDFLDRQILLQAEPGTFFITDHYLNYPTIFVRLEKVRRSALPDLIERAWRMVAPAKLVAEHDAQNSRNPTGKSTKRPRRAKR